MSTEELAEPLTPRRPSLVSDAPDLGPNLWHPLLADSEHASAWWMLSQDELKTVTSVIEERTERKATSRMTGSTPKPQVVIKKEKPTPKPKGTTSKSRSSEAVPPPKPKSVEALPASQTTPENILHREPKGPPPARSQAPSAGIREQSNPRGTAGRTELGIMGMMQRGRAMGFGTPSVAPQKAKGAVPHSPRVETPPRSRSAERSGDRTTSRVDTPPRSRSAERDDRRDGGDTPILQPTPIALVIFAVGLDVWWTVREVFVRRERKRLWDRHGNSKKGWTPSEYGSVTPRNAADVEKKIIQT